MIIKPFALQQFFPKLRHFLRKTIILMELKLRATWLHKDAMTVESGFSPLASRIPGNKISANICLFCMLLFERMRVKPGIVIL